MEFQSLEKGHAKNVNNFASLLVSVEVLGAYYNPQNENLKLSNLKLVLKQAQNVMQGAALALSVYAVAVESRKRAWEGIDQLAGRILALCAESELKVVVEIPSLLKTVRGSNVMVAGQAAISQRLRFNSILSRNSFEKRLDSFAHLVLLLKESKVGGEDKGQLLIASLEALYSNFKSKNINVKLAEAALNTARYNRDILLYRQEHNLVWLAEEVKEYIKSALGPSYIQYVQIMSTSFKSH